MGTETLYTIKAKQNGCIVLGFSTTYYSLFDVSSKNTYTIKDKYGAASYYVPMQKGDKFAIKNTENGTRNIYVGFIPEDNIFHIDESKKKSNGTLSFTFGNVYGNDTKLMISASKEIYPTRQILTDDIMLKSYQSTTLYEYSSVANDEGDAVLTLPESGEYSLTIRLKMNNDTIAIGYMILDTDAYINPSLKKLEQPIAAIADTNLMVGFGEPLADVVLSYDGKKYKAKCDSNGIYRIILDNLMKKGVKYKIWQTNGKVTSKKASYRVTSE